MAGRLLILFKKAKWPNRRDATLCDKTRSLPGASWRDIDDIDGALSPPTVFGKPVPTP